MKRTEKNTQNTQNAMQEQNAQNAIQPYNPDSVKDTGIKGGITFDKETILSQFATTTIAENGQEVTSYKMVLDVLEKDKLEVDKLEITDASAIEAIVGLQNADKLEKWSAYRKGAYLVQLANSSFMGSSDKIKSVEHLAKSVNIGVEGSSANALESVSRRLGVRFENGELHFADDTLPVLPFWHYNNIISLVTYDDDKQAYDYSALKAFIAKYSVSALMSQKRLKECFNEYRYDTANLNLPDKVREKADKDKQNADKRKEKADAAQRQAEEAKSKVSAKLALENAKDFRTRKAVTLTALDALIDCVTSLKISEVYEGLVYDCISQLREMITECEERKEEE